MRIASSILAVSWIPSEAIAGLPSLPFEGRVTHYDDPPPDAIGDSDEVGRLAEEGRFRFANLLSAWAEIDDGRLVDYGHSGHGFISSTRVTVARRSSYFKPIALPDIQPPPIVSESGVLFRQTTGGRTGLPAPRHVSRPPFVQWLAPLAWTTLELELGFDGSHQGRLVGASPFPRHWIYSDGELVSKSGLIDFKSWYRSAFGKHTPWGDEDSPALITEVESALERDLSSTIMRGGAAPARRRLAEGEVLVRQGESGDQMFLLLDGVLKVEVDEQPVIEIGPGAVLGERALLEGGRRTATLVAASPCRIAVVDPDQVDEEALRRLAELHRREDGLR